MKGSAFVSLAAFRVGALRGGARPKSGFALGPMSCAFGALVGTQDQLASQRGEQGAERFEFAVGS